MNTFSPSPWSNGLVTMTIIGLVIIFGVMAYLCYRYFSHSNIASYQIIFWIVMVILVISVLSSVALMPRGVSTDEKGITVHLLLKKIDIPAAEIDSISAYPANTKTIRVIGIGGLFGNVGLFSNERIGRFDCYVTDFSRSYVIYRKTKRPIVVSVTNPAIFDGYKVVNRR